jgi:hypothetical protein
MAEQSLARKGGACAKLWAEPFLPGLPIGEAPIMVNKFLITDNTRLVLGDWVCSPPDREGMTNRYRLAGWSASTERWLLYRDGMDPVINGHVALTMITQDLIAKGFSKLANRRSWGLADAPVYMMTKSGPDDVFHQVASGTDPLMVRF